MGITIKQLGVERIFKALDSPPHRRLVGAVYVMGYNSLMCCLSTIIEGQSRGHKLTFIEDASMAIATPNADEAAAHVHGVDLIAVYASVVDTEDVLRDESARHMPMPQAYVRSPCQPEASA